MRSNIPRIYLKNANIAPSVVSSLNAKIIHNFINP